MSTDEQATQPDGPDLAGRPVLIVDDEPHNLIALRRLLQRQGLDVTEADNGARAVVLLSAEDHPYEMVFMDVMMPIMDGLTAIQRIRGMPHNQDLPIIALTAMAMQGDREACLEAGANDYISKPVSDTAIVVDSLREWLAARRATPDA